MKTLFNLFYTILLLALFHPDIYAQNKDSLRMKFEIPAFLKSDTPIVHTGFTLLYNEKYEQASWVAYELTEERTKKAFERSNQFLEDPKVKSGSATDKDYAGSGYDRGHLAPAADMSWSELTMKESFYYSNMSPQVPSFNRGVWKRLEEQVRDWAIEYKQLFVVTGPVLKDTIYKTIGENHVAVPLMYYKVLLDTINQKGIGFFMANLPSTDPLQDFAVSIDQVEAVTKIDFFPNLTKKQEKSIESTVCKACWNFKNSSNSQNSTDSYTELARRTESVRCVSKTKSGKRCKSKTLSPNSKCSKHGGN